MVSLGQKFRTNLHRWFWLSISHEVALKIRSSNLKAFQGLENPLLTWLTHIAIRRSPHVSWRCLSSLNSGGSSVLQSVSSMGAGKEGSVRSFSFRSHIQLLLLRSFSSVQFSYSVVSDSLWPHESQHTRPPCPSPTPGDHSDSRPSSRWCRPAISSSSSPSPPAPNPSQHQGLFQWVNSSHEVAKVLEFQL